MKKLHLNIIILAWVIKLMMTSCYNGRENGKSGFINKKYEGFWADTFWTYEFKSNGEFTFKSVGHFGTANDTGIYFMKDSLLLLNPRTDWHVLAGVLKSRLRIIDDDCIRDFDCNYYCISLDTIGRFTQKELAFQNSVIKIIDTLQVVNEEKERLISHYPGEELVFEIIYDGIIVIDNREFHKFNLSRYDDREGQLTCLSFLATKKPFDVFQPGSAGNGLSLIYK